MWWRRRLKTWPRLTILIHDDHRLGFMSSDQIVQNEVLMALVRPTGFVFSIPVLKIKDRVA